jgi:hypothetical protein
MRATAGHDTTNSTVRTDQEGGAFIPRRQRINARKSSLSVCSVDRTSFPFLAFRVPSFSAEACVRPSMRLSELLVPQHVVIPVEASDKWQAISALARTTVESGRLPKAMADTVQQALAARERQMTTGMENGIAIPHAAVEGIPDVLAVLGLSRTGIPFGRSTVNRRGSWSA